MRKNHTWPDLYWAEIPLKNPSNKEVASYKLPLLLPHEWVSDYLHQPGASQEAQPEEGSYLDKECNRVCAAWHRQARSMVPLGLHGDGVPTATPHARAGPLFRYSKFWIAKGHDPWPLQEEMVYTYFEEVGPSTAQTHLRSCLISMSSAMHVLN